MLNFFSGKDISTKKDNATKTLKLSMVDMLCHWVDKGGGKRPYQGWFSKQSVKYPTSN